MIFNHQTNYSVVYTDKIELSPNGIVNVTENGLIRGIQNPNFKFGYSYDITVSRLTNATAGAHEISFAMQLECKPKKKRYRTINCPSF